MMINSARRGDNDTEEAPKDRRIQHTEEFQNAERSTNVQKKQHNAEEGLDSETTQHA